MPRSEENKHCIKRRGPKRGVYQKKIAMCAAVTSSMLPDLSDQARYNDDSNGFCWLEDESAYYNVQRVKKIGCANLLAQYVFDY